MSKIYDLSAVTIGGEVVSLGSLRDKTLLIVNVASQCGLTPQYEALERLYQKYCQKGLEVLGFPCNQFGEQEPGSEQEIKAFCESKFSVSFSLFSKICVNGPNAHPLYQLLKDRQPGEAGQDIKWNFTKFLVDKDGQVVGRFEPKIEPEDISSEIEKIL